MTRHFTIVSALTLFVGSFHAQDGMAQVVRFRLETTDLTGAPVDVVDVGDEFQLRVFTQHVGGFESEANSGVYAGYLDITYDPSLASAGDNLVHGELYLNGKAGDVASPGLIDNVGGFSSSGEDGIGLVPIGLDEQFLVSIPMFAEQPGLISFDGSESLTYPEFDVLVYGENLPVPARDIDFGAVDARIAFGSTSLSIQPIPEPGAILLATIGLIGLWHGLRRPTRVK